MEQLILNIQDLSTIPEELNDLHVLLNRAQDSLRTESIRLLPLLDQLDPSVHSLGYLYILEGCTSAALSKEQASAVVLPTARFMILCNKEQILLAPEKFISVCKRFKDYVVQLDAPIRGVVPMMTAIRKIQRSSKRLTPLHPEFLQLCLLSKCYKARLSVLDKDFSEVDHPIDLLLYCYYWGMICIAQKRFQKALKLLHIVVTAPVSISTAEAVEAYKKYILVSLIHNGKLCPSVSDYTSSVAQSNMCQPYLELADSYRTGKIADIDAVAQRNREKFDTDNNFGLVNQAISSMYKHNIQKLTQTNETISLEDIANYVELNSAKEAEMHVLQMIQDGLLFATIQTDGMVSFFNDRGTVERNDSSMQGIMALSRKLTTLFENSSFDPAHLAEVWREAQQLDFDDFTAESSTTKEGCTATINIPRPDEMGYTSSFVPMNEAARAERVSTTNNFFSLRDERLRLFAERVRATSPEPSPFPGSCCYFMRDAQGRVSGLPEIPPYFVRNVPERVTTALEQLGYSPELILKVQNEFDVVKVEQGACKVTRILEREENVEKQRRDLARDAAKTEEKNLELLFSQWREHHKRLSKFIRTKAEPPIYYLPKKALDEDATLAEQKKEKEFLEWKAARREELSDYQKQIKEQYLANVEKELERWQYGSEANNDTHGVEHGPMTDGFIDLVMDYLERMY